MRGWIRFGLRGRDTYGPMYYPGMRSLWQSPANFHQHLALSSHLLFHQDLLPSLVCYLLLQLPPPSPTLLTVNRKKENNNSLSGPVQWCVVLSSSTVILLMEGRRIFKSVDAVTPKPTE